jgi:hypothetical protein
MLSNGTCHMSIPRPSSFTGYLVRLAELNLTPILTQVCANCERNNNHLQSVSLWVNYGRYYLP